MRILAAVATEEHLKIGLEGNERPASARVMRLPVTLFY